jgi:hypothetical protein
MAGSGDWLEEAGLETMHKMPEKTSQLAEKKTDGDYVDVCCKRVLYASQTQIQYNDNKWTCTSLRSTEGSGAISPWRTKLQSQHDSTRIRPFPS